MIRVADFLAATSGQYVRTMSDHPSSVRSLAQVPATPRVPWTARRRDGLYVGCQTGSVLVDPLPGVNRDHLRDTLVDLYTKVLNLPSVTSQTATHGRLLAYLDWTNEAVSMLRHLVRQRDIDHLVLTRRHELLLSMVGRFGPDMTFPAVNGLLSGELEERMAAFQEAIASLDSQMEGWSRSGAFVVLDTSVFIMHPQKFDEIDYASLLSARGEPVHLLVPIVVIDELDGLKQHKDKKIRWRAGYSLAVLDRVLRNPTWPSRLREEDFSALKTGGIPCGEVTIEILLDPPGHVRLPINDDEIVDRTLAAQPLAGRCITLVTYDTGQSMRARAVRLPVTKLSQAVEHQET